MIIAARLICIVIGYAFGLFQTGFIYGKTQGIDIRTKGSGNAGTTNSLRVLGTKAGAITFFGDCMKSILAILCARLLFGVLLSGMVSADALKLLELYAGFGVVLGHNYPFYMGFRGGKGIASTFGVMLALCPWIALICVVVFIIIFAITHYVSLGSVVIVTVFLVGVVIANHMLLLGVAPMYNIEFDVVAACFTAMAIWRHRANIKRLATHSESKVYLFKR